MPTETVDPEFKERVDRVRRRNRRAIEEAEKRAEELKREADEARVEVDRAVRRLREVGALKSSD
jgi:hypothetical protein